MLGSGEEPDPLIMKKVEHRGKIPYHKSTTNHNKGKISIKIIPQNCWTWKTRLLQMLKTFLERYTFSSNYPEQSTRAQPAARSLTVYTTTECRRSRMFPLAGKRCCTCVSGVIAAYAASASLRKISFSQDTTESPAGWSLRSSVRFMN